MATIQQMLETHNSLAIQLGQPELASWKQAGDTLQARIDAMQALVDADEADLADEAAQEAEGIAALESTTFTSIVEADFADLEARVVASLTPDEWEQEMQTHPVLDFNADAFHAEESANMTDETDPLETETPDPLDIPADLVTETQEPAAEKPKGKPKDPRGTIGDLIKLSLIDESIPSYERIVEIVLATFPEAQTTRRSIASVAADLRRKGVEVPKRRAVKQAEGE